MWKIYSALSYFGFPVLKWDLSNDPTGPSNCSSGTYHLGVMNEWMDVDEWE